MKLTRSQMHERAGSLSGEIKAAREAQSECRRALEDQERLVTIAAQAVERADARVNELLTERAQLSVDMAEAILRVGEAPSTDETAVAPKCVHGNLLAGPCEKCRLGEGPDTSFPNHYTNGTDEHVTRAFDEVTRP